MHKQFCSNCEIRNRIRTSPNLWPRDARLYHDPANSAAHRRRISFTITVIKGTLVTGCPRQRVPRNELSGGDRMRAKGQGSAVHGTAGWPGALRGPARRCIQPPELLQSGPGVMRISDRYATPGAPTAGCRRGRTAPRRREGSRLDAGAGGSPPSLTTTAEASNPTLPAIVKVPQACSVPVRSIAVGTESCPRPRATRTDAGPPSVRVGHRGRGSVYGTPIGKAGPYCPHPGAGIPRTERRRSHLRQRPCRMWRTFGLYRHRPGHPGTDRAWEAGRDAGLPSGLLNSNPREDRNDESRRPSAAPGGG